MSPGPPHLFVAALAEELSGLRARVQGRTRLAGPGRLRLETGRVDGTPVVLAATGDGAPAAEAGMRWLLSTRAFRSVTVLGVAGALSPELPLGALLAAREVTRPGGPALVSRAPWPPRVRSNVATGLVVSVPQLAGSAEEKARLRTAHAGWALAVVDLESWTFAQAAEEAGLPWRVLRVVSDTHQEALPSVVLAAQDGAGAVRRGAVAAGLLRTPWVVPRLLALRQRMQEGARSLSHHALALLEDSSPSPAGRGPG